MRIALVHNQYGRFSGEEGVVEYLQRLLLGHGHSVETFFRSSAQIHQRRLGKAHAFFSGIYCRAARQAFRGFLAEVKPDIVHIHNVFPLISPAVLPVCAEAGVPIVMSVHNYRLVCPNGLHMPRGRFEVCAKCSGGREYWCVLRNCEQDLAKSLGYGLRNYVARKSRVFLDNVVVFVCLTDFQKRRLAGEGYPEDRLVVVPNAVEVTDLHPGNALGAYAGYVGRVSPEKGIECLLQAATRLPDIPFRIAGDCSSMPQVSAEAGKNVRLCGHLSREQTVPFYQASRFVVLPSIWFEAFPLVLIEAMAHSKPVIASRIGGLPEIVDDGRTGLLFEPGDAAELAERIHYLWVRPRLCRQMGQAGREKALREYSTQQYYGRLMAVYRQAIELGPAGPKRRLS